MGAFSTFFRPAFLNVALDKLRTESRCRATEINSRDDISSPRHPEATKSRATERHHDRDWRWSREDSLIFELAYSLVRVYGTPTIAERTEKEVGPNTRRPRQISDRSFATSGADEQRIAAGQIERETGPSPAVDLLSQSQFVEDTSRSLHLGSRFQYPRYPSRTVRNSDICQDRSPRRLPGSRRPGPPPLAIDHIHSHTWRSFSKRQAVSCQRRTPQ